MFGYRCHSNSDIPVQSINHSLCPRVKVRIELATYISRKSCNVDLSAQRQETAAKGQH